MNEMIEYMKKRIKKIILFLVIAFAAPMLVVHLLFSIEAPAGWIAAKWSAGDLLTYIAGFESFVGTMTLGIVAAYQTKQSNALQRISVQQMLPVVNIASVKVHKWICIDRKMLNDSARFDISNVFSGNDYHPQINVYMTNAENSADTYMEKVELCFTSFADTPITRIVIDKIEFPSCACEDGVQGKVVCVGSEENNFINKVLPPKGRFNVTLNIYFNGRVLQKNWRLYNDCDEFRMRLFLKNYSQYSAGYNETIDITKYGETEARVSYMFSEEGL